MKTKHAVLAMFAATLAFCVFIGATVQGSANDNSKELQLVHVIMRHGIRTPVDTYPKDPHKNDSFYPVGWGQLTNNGKHQLYSVGQYLRERYAKFLGTHYDPNQYFTLATDVDRTKSSVQLVNAGLWPPEEAQKWGPIDWQPIPVHSQPLNDDHLLLVRRPCPKYHKELEKVMQSKEIQDKLKENAELFKELTELTGLTIKNFDDVQDVYSTLRAEEALNLTLPDWTKKYYPTKMFEPTIFSYVLNAYNDNLNRLKGGVLLKKLISDWKSKIDGTISPKAQKAFLYGGHDSTISNILSTLKVWDPQVPEYAITILMELSKDVNTKVYGVEVFLRNSTTAAPHLLTIPGCQSFCPLDKLVELTANVIPKNWEEECKVDDVSYTPPPLRGP